MKILHAIDQFGKDVFKENHLIAIVKALAILRHEVVVVTKVSSIPSALLQELLDHKVNVCNFEDRGWKRIKYSIIQVYNAQTFDQIPIIENHCLKQSNLIQLINNEDERIYKASNLFVLSSNHTIKSTYFIPEPVERISDLEKRCVLSHTIYNQSCFSIGDIYHDGKLFNDAKSTLTDLNYSFIDFAYSSSKNLKVLLSVNSIVLAKEGDRLIVEAARYGKGALIYSVDKRNTFTRSLKSSMDSSELIHHNPANVARRLEGIYKQIINI